MVVRAGFIIRLLRVLVWSVCCHMSSDVSGSIKLLTLCSFRVFVLLCELMFGLWSIFDCDL